MRNRAIERQRSYQTGKTKCAAAYAESYGVDWSLVTDEVANDFFAYWASHAETFAEARKTDSLTDVRVQVMETYWRRLRCESTQAEQ